MLSAPAWLDDTTPIAPIAFMKNTIDCNIPVAIRTILPGPTSHELDITVHGAMGEVVALDVALD